MANAMTDDEILFHAKVITKRRARERKLAKAKEFRRKPEQIARVREWAQRPESQEKDRDRTRAAYWAKHHPGQPVPPGRLEKERWFGEQDERIRAAEEAVLND